MPGRPLSYLATVDVARVEGIGPRMATKLTGAGVATVADLILHVPRRYLDRSELFDLAGAPLGEEVTVGGIVQSFSKRRIRGNRTMVEAVVSDGTSRVRVVWFNPYLNLDEGAEVALSGKLERFRGVLQMKGPDVERLERIDDSLVTGRVVPVHSAVAGLRPSQIRSFIHSALGTAQPVAEVLPDEMRRRHRLVTRTQALASVHFPDEMKDVWPARRRLIFDELFRLEVALAIRKHRQASQATGVAHDGAGTMVPAFVAALPYQLTAAQRRSIDEIVADMTATQPMHRLLQGEVGSGKTVVAFAALLTGVQGGYQGAVMAPTEVLAEQHYLGMSGLISDAGMQPPVTESLGRKGVGDDQPSLFETAAPPGPEPERSVRMVLLTSHRAAANFAPGARRTDVVRWIADGTADLVVGTHALIQEGLEFHRLGIAVVDEQHRFGVYQRVRLREKSAEHDPDLLIMTATPIPRTLAMTLYGDLDVSVLDEMPPGRTPVATHLVGKDPASLGRVHDLIRRQVGEGRQAFVVCPLVNDSDKLEASSATAEYQRLEQVFPELRLGLLHGQLRPEEKDAVMVAFRNRQLDVLVATTVIEVGIDVPNATVMVIEDADRFGLSQLHQLRGRVGRGRHASTCVLVAEPATEDGEQRLAAMVATTDGFRLAEEDLRIRGQGTVLGERQAGTKEFRLADILRDAKLLVAARTEAFALVAEDPHLDGHSELRDEIRVFIERGEDDADENLAEWLLRS